MPTDVHQFLAPNVPDFAHVMIVGPIRDDRPFVRDLNHVVSTEPSSCDRVHYCAPRPGTLHPTRAGFYFVGDFDYATEEIGDVLTFNRRWATIPSTRIDPAGSYAFGFPGLPNGTTGSAKTITAITPENPTEAVLNNPALTAAAHGFAVGQLINYLLNYTGGTAGSKVIGGTARVLTVPDINTFTLSTILQFFGPDGSYDVGAFSTGTATAFAPARAARTIKASASIVFTYALPGVTPGIATEADFRADTEFRPVITSTTEETDTLSVATTPTDTAYRELVDAGTGIVAESTIDDYLPPILVRATYMVPAL